MIRTKQIIPYINASSKAPPKKTFFRVATVIVKNRRNDEIMMIGAGNEYDPGYSVSGTVNSGVPN